MQLADFFKKYVYPVAVISGSIIGVGFFSLPYIALKSGTWIMLLYFFILTGVVLTIHLIFAEISLKTPDFKRFPGFVKYYFGKYAQAFSLFSTILGYYGVLLIYLIVGSEFLANILQPYFGGSNTLYAIIYFLFASCVIWFGIKAVSKIELLVLSILFVSVIFIFAKGILQSGFSNIFLFSPDFSSNGFGLKSVSNLFLPYGAILFSLWGAGLIPEAEEMEADNKKSIKKIVLTATLIPAIFYVFFTFLILSITGLQTTEFALTGLKDFLGENLSLIVFFIGIASTITACVAQGLTLKKVFAYDLKVKNWQAFIMTCSVPMILYLLGLKSFISLISFIGGVLLGIDGIFILLMYKKIGGKRIIIYPLSFIFLLGIVYQVFYFFI
jgi:amino acid permease